MQGWPWAQPRPRRCQPCWPGWRARQGAPPRRRRCPVCRREERWWFEGEALLDHACSEDVAHAIPEVGLVEGTGHGEERGVQVAGVAGAEFRDGLSVLGVVCGPAPADAGGLGDDGPCDEADVPAVRSIERRVAPLKDSLGAQVEELVDSEVGFDLRDQR